MKTATATWISYNNYGTLLQAYALQKQLELLGHENVILNDSQILKEFFAAKRKSAPPAEPARKAAEPAPEGALQRVKRLLADPGVLSRRLLARFDPKRYGAPYEDSQRACQAFKAHSLNILDVQPGELDRLNDRFDAFLCGSDQVWSVFDSIFNPYYYLDFARGRKIAYAPCLGTDQIPDSTAGRIRELLADFTAISARENVSAKQLSEITGREVAWVCDPTLLHDRDFWSDFAGEAPQRRKKYLLCYFLESNPWYFDRAKALAKRMGLKIRLVPSRWEHLGSQYVIDEAIGPREFVALFRDASYVLTDSYHGSIFSLIFEKDFQYLLRFALDDPASQNIRVQSLFGRLGLEDRVVTQQSHAVQMHMNYQPIQRKLAEFRAESGAYLERSLAREGNV